MAPCLTLIITLPPPFSIKRTQEIDVESSGLEFPRAVKFTFLVYYFESNPE